MQETMTFTRRKAASLLTAAFAAATAPALDARQAAASQSPPAFGAEIEGLLAQSQRHLLRMLSSVRRTSGSASLGAAFDRFKGAFAVHDYAKSMAAARQADRGFGLPSDGLYRQVDSGQILARVIVRELDAWPKSDALWLQRFSDLESVVRERNRVALHTA